MGEVEAISIEKVLEINRRLEDEKFTGKVKIRYEGGKIVGDIITETPLELGDSDGE